jgi:hypothetical protein
LVAAYCATVRWLTASIEKRRGIYEGIAAIPMEWRQNRDQTSVILAFIPMTAIVMYGFVRRFG